MRRGLVLAARETAAVAASAAAPRELARAHPLLARRHRRHDAAERGEDDERTDHARVTPPPVARARVTAEHRLEFGLSLDSLGRGERHHRGVRRRSRVVRTQNARERFARVQSVVRDARWCRARSTTTNGALGRRMTTCNTIDANVRLRASFARVSTTSSLL